MKKGTLKFTGDIWKRMNAFQMDFAFEGEKLGDLLDALFVKYDLRDLVIDDQRNIIPYSRVIVDGHYAENIGNLEAPVQDGFEVVLVRPFLVM
jgi:hypothetical protein